MFVYEGVFVCVCVCLVVCSFYFSSFMYLLYTIAIVKLLWPWP